MWPNPDDPTVPQWLPLDREHALLWQQHEAARCPGCGAFPDDFPKDERLELPPYIAVPYRCGFCADIATVRAEEVPDDEERSRGVYVGLEPFDEDRIDEYEAESQKRREAIVRAEKELDPAKLNEGGMLGEAGAADWSRPPV